MVEDVLELDSMDEETALALGEGVWLLWRASRTTLVPPTLVVRPSTFPEETPGDADRLPWDVEMRLSKAYDAAGGDGATVSAMVDGEWRGSQASYARKSDLIRGLPALWRASEAGRDVVTLVSFHAPAEAEGAARIAGGEAEAEAGSGPLDPEMWDEAAPAWAALAEAVGSDLVVHWILAGGRLLVTSVDKLEAPPEPLSLPDKGVQWGDVKERLEAARAADMRFGDGRILGSMCTAPLPEAVKASTMFPEANLGNPGLCPGTAALEEEVVRILADMLHGAGAFGQMLSGSTEGNITALWVARNASRGREVLFPESAHFSIRKACDLLDMVPVAVGLDDGYRMDVDDLRRKLSDDVAAVVAFAGTTELGVVDPIQEIGDVCGEDVFLHVDAAYGGFVLPFLGDLGREVPPFDFRVPAVTSITLDGHKMGMAPIPSSALLVRDGELLREIVHRSPYLTKLEHTALLGTRASSGVAGTYASLMSLGREGFAEIVAGAMDVAQLLAAGVRKMGLDLAVEPETPILGVLVKDPEAVRGAMAEKGWVLSLSRHPPCLRLVVMPHVTRRSAEALLEDLETVCRDLGEI